MNYRVTAEDTIKRADEIVDYLRAPRLWVPQTDYPDFDRWLTKTYKQFKSEQKRALITISDRKIVGVVIYQTHHSYPHTLEIKNISISPSYTGRYLASFMLRNAELEGKRDFKTTSVHIDAKADNIAIRKYLNKNGYTALFATNLYGLDDHTDMIYYK